MDIVDTATQAGSFQTLLGAAKSAGLVATLKGTGPFTVFAPNDEAFAKLPAGTVDSLLKPENHEKLKALLTYHVISGKFDSSKVTSGDMTSVQGKTLHLHKNGGVKVNASKVIQADVMADNGVIHVIDTVLSLTP
jgi:uncharacterized surface protein with fasciclin (FAS1) repeats